MMKINFFSFLVMMPLAVVCQSWNTTGSDSNKGTQWFETTPGSKLGYSIRTNGGGGWAWQLVDANYTSYFHVDYGTGRVGIGTPSPSQKLHVEGNLYVNSGSFLINQTTGSNAKFYFLKLGNYTWDLGTEVSDPSNNFLLFNRANSTYPIAISTSNVPTFKTDKIRLEGMSTAEGNIWDIKCRDIVDNDFGIYNVSQSSYRFYINNLGYVGIGTSSPADQLEVVKGNRKVGINTDVPGVAEGGIISLTRPDDGLKTFYIGASESPSDDNVIFSQGGSAELRLVSNGGPYASAGFGFYNNISLQSAFGTSRPTPVMKIDGFGNVGIGTTTPDAKLAVNGTIHTQEVKVDLDNWPDYVFDPDYKLQSVQEIADYIQSNKHLPNVPSSKDVEANGVNLGEMNKILLQKIEELTLYQIKATERIEYLESKMKELLKTKE